MGLVQFLHDFSEYFSVIRLGIASGVIYCLSFLENILKKRKPAYILCRLSHSKKKIINLSGSHVNGSLPPFSQYPAADRS